MYHSNVQLNFAHLAVMEAKLITLALFNQIHAQPATQLIKQFYKNIISPFLYQRLFTDKKSHGVIRVNQ